MDHHGQDQISAKVDSVAAYARNLGGSPRRRVRSAPDPIEGLVRTGYVSAIVIPILGIVLGIVVATRPSALARHGQRILALSIAAAMIWGGVTYAVVHHAQEQAAAARQAQINACLYVSVYDC